MHDKIHQILTHFIQQITNKKNYIHTKFRAFSLHKYLEEKKNKKNIIDKDSLLKPCCRRKERECAEEKWTEGKKEKEEDKCTDCDLL